MTDTTTVADALDTRPDTLEAYVDDDTTAVEVLGRFGGGSDARALVEAWLGDDERGVCVSEASGGGDARDGDDTEGGAPGGGGDGHTSVAHRGDVREGDEAAPVTESNSNDGARDRQSTSERLDKPSETPDGVGAPTDAGDAGAGTRDDSDPYRPTCDTTDGPPGYAALFDAARRRAGREPWEHVEGEHLREVLEEHDLGHLLDTSALYNTAGWRHVDLSDDDEPADPRWYFSTGDEPRPDEFRRFHELLMAEAPDGYTPHYFRVARAGKEPATQFGGWKRDDARLTVEEAVAWMEKGGNVGIAGRGGCRACGGRASGWCPECEGEGNDDALVNVDIDDDEETTPGDVPTSLWARSRSRTGWHSWYFDDGEEPIPNIPTDDYGEIRTEWQYVVAPGSFVASAAEHLPDDPEDPGYYTVEDPEPVARIGYDDLPDVFIEVAEATEEPGEQQAGGDASTDASTDLDLDEDDLPDDRRSGVFDIDASDLVTNSDEADRFGSIFHDSTTGANMSVSGGKLHCWRHLVAHGGLQALATLSDKTTKGCRDLGAPHKNSNAGSNRLKGDWELVWAAWHYAKRDGILDDDDPLPYRVLLGLALEAAIVEDREALVERDQDTGALVEDPDNHNGDTYTALPPGTYNDALEYADEEADVPLGREPVETTAREDETTSRDLLMLDVVVEPRNALAAAAAVEPDDLERDLPELEHDDVDDVAIAVALAEGWIGHPGEFPTDGRYTEAYYRARDHYGAPLPKYLDNSTLEEREDLVFAALQRITPEHILDTCRSEVTVEDPPGKPIAKLDPTWEDSESGERILAGYGSGFYCVEHDVSFSPIQLVALEHDLYPDELEGAAREHAYPRGEAFKTAYRLLREEYGAPLPKWRATLLEHVAVLPPSVRLLDDDISAKADGYSLDEAREATEALLRDAVTVRDRAQLVTATPGTGKTYGTAALAADRPVLYITQRNALKQQMEEYVATVCDDEEHHPDAEPTAAHLPILAEDTLPEAALGAGVAAVREHDRDLLREPDTLYQHVADELEDRPETDEEEDVVDLDRATCPAADGEHGERWAVRLQVARALGHTPAELHRRATALFGEELPCQHDGECPYSAAWDRISDPANPIELLIGAPQHARVTSATTYYERVGDGETRTTDRAVVVDEFPGESYFSSYGERYMDHAVWLAEALVGVDNREDLLDAELETDTWVSRWLEGEGNDLVAATDAIAALEAASAIADAVDTATGLLERDATDDVAGVTSASIDRIRAALATVAEADPADAAALESARQDLAAAARQLETDADRAYADDRDGAGDLYTLADTLEDLVEDLGRGAALVDEGEAGDALATVRDRLDAVPAGGDLRALLDAAVDAVRGEAPDGLLDAAVTALRGGRDGCRELAIFADDGYAHPSAWALLAGAIATPDADDVREITTESFAFDRERDDGGRFKRLQKNGATVAADRNHHGALVVDPPAFTDRDGRKCPVVGLDATGRPTLWRQAIGRDTQRRDIHDTDAERRRFLRDAVDLTVVQTTEDPLPYHSDPTGKNFQEDLELVETAAEEYTGPSGLDEKAPAVISTKKVLGHLEEDLEDHAGATVNYENMKGSDALGEHQVLVALGSQHYGDAVPEKWALVAGESAGRGDTRGDTLDYGSDVANAYLKHMREDHTMQAILRAGRNDDATVAVAHTGALRPDLPVEADGAVVSAHSSGALAVAEAAAELRGSRFTARDVADAIGGVESAVGLRQVQNVLADFRDAGYLRVEEEGDRGRAFQYDLEEDPGRADVELPDLEAEARERENEISGNDTYYTWDFVLAGPDRGRDRGAPPGAPTIPARDTADAPEATVAPPD